MVQRHSPLTVTLNSSTGPTVDDWWGFAVFENASTAAFTEVLFKDGTSTGQILWPLLLNADESAGTIFPGSITVPSGVLHVDTTGSIGGVVFV